MNLLTDLPVLSMDSLRYFTSSSTVTAPGTAFWPLIPGRRTESPATSPIEETVQGAYILFEDVHIGLDISESFFNRGYDLHPCVFTDISNMYGAGSHKAKIQSSISPAGSTSNSTSTSTSTSTGVCSTLDAQTDVHNDTHCNVHTDHKKQTSVNGNLIHLPIPPLQRPSFVSSLGWMVPIAFSHLKEVRDDVRTDYRVRKQVNATGVLSISVESLRRRPMDLLLALDAVRR